MSVKILQVFTVTLLCIKYCLCEFDNVDQSLLHDNEFDVKPGGMTQSFKETWGGISCEFTYACQGGTNEKWLIRMIKSDDGSQIKCSVERPGGSSYLFFQLFEMNVIGGLIKEAQVIGENGQHLGSSEYVIDEGKNLVRQVDGEFQSHLNKVEVLAVVTKEEL